MTQRKIAEAFPPGEFIQEELDARGWSQIELAEIIGCHPTVVNAWVRGKRAITAQTAKQLGDAFGMSAHWWINQQTYYDLWKEEEVDTGIARRAKVYGYGPIKDLMKRQWVEHSESIDVLESRIMDFYCVPNLEEKPQLPHAARKNTPDEPNVLQLAWLFRARRLAKCLTANPFTEQSFEEALLSLKVLKANTEDTRLIPKVLAQFGIKFLIIEQLSSGAGIDGVTFWDQDWPVIALSLRYDRIDSFWFTLAHELGHIKNRDAQKGSMVLDIDLVGEKAQRFEEKSDTEKRADLFSSEFLVPEAKLESFISRKGPLFSKIKINDFARVQAVHPGIVVGQLQHRGCIHWRNHRPMLEKVRTIVTASALTDGWGQAPVGV
ncbi:MAG: HigA family addiction module antidote protein [Nitrospirales bacterium]|nr:HigA family addiction module antidote protein [Nitrospirales bacterium]MBA3966293.1 HigA family addiction module antidote protein [Nitrospirales bacterium]